MKTIFRRDIITDRGIERTRKIIDRWSNILGVLACFAAGIFIILPACCTIYERESKAISAESGVADARTKRLIAKHGTHVAIEEHSGKIYFYREGKRCALK